MFPRMSWRIVATFSNAEQNVANTLRRLKTLKKRWKNVEKTLQAN
jgi:hypothetical protein